MKPGQEVVATAFGGKKLKRVACQVLENTVVICTPEEWELARRENRQPNGVGFPRCEVQEVNGRKAG